MGSPLATKLVTPLNRGHKHARDLAGAWRYIEGAGPTIRDASRYQSHGTIAGNPTWEHGSRGLSLLHDRTGDFITTATIPPVGGDPRTFVMWFRTDVVDTTEQKIFGYGTSGNGTSVNISIEIAAGGAFFLFRHGGGNIRYPTPVAGQEHCLIMVFPDGASTDDVLVYVDGTIRAGVRNAGSNRTINTGSSALYIGSNNDGATSRPFLGLISEFRVYTRALDYAETLEIYLDPNALYRVQPFPAYFHVAAPPAGGNPKGPLTMPLCGAFRGPI